MPLGEFELIDRYFRAAGALRADVVLGVGDDGALLRPPAEHDLVAVSDTLVEGVHFPKNSPPQSIGHRALAVNLSDIAAMGATPAWALLSLTLPNNDEPWIAAFARGFSALAVQHEVALVGGDTTRGPLTIGVQVLGVVPRGKGLRRAGAQVGDRVFVSGTPGDAAAGLEVVRGALVPGKENTPRGAAAREELRARFEYPTPRLALGRLLLELASACIDVSDGLAGDLAKLATASGCGARIDLARLRPSAALAAAADPAQARQWMLSGGDDYELLFTISPQNVSKFEALRIEGVQEIGVLVPGAGVELCEAGRRIGMADAGFDHFG